MAEILNDSLGSLNLISKRAYTSLLAGASTNLRSYFQYIWGSKVSMRLTIKS